MDFDKIVQSYVSKFRIIFIGIFAMLSFALVYFDLLGLILVLIPVFFIGYSIGMKYLPEHIVKSFDPDDLILALQNKKINDINDRIASGELKPGKEMDDLMRQSGLRPMSVIVQKGPVIGRFADSDMHEWLEATEGHDGELSRYDLVGKAQIAENGAVVTPSMYNLYIVLEGILYEAKMPEIA